MKKKEETGINRKKQEETGRNRKIQKETGRNGKKHEETGKNSKKPLANCIYGSNQAGGKEDKKTFFLSTSACSRDMILFILMLQMVSIQQIGRRHQFKT